MKRLCFLQNRVIPLLGVKTGKVVTVAASNSRGLILKSKQSQRIHDFQAIIEPELVFALSQLFDALHDPSILDARRHQRYGLDAPLRGKSPPSLILSIIDAAIHDDRSSSTRYNVDNSLILPHSLRLCPRIIIVLSQACSDVNRPLPSFPDFSGPLMLTSTSGKEIQHETDVSSLLQNTVVTSPSQRVPRRSRRMSTSDLHFVRFLGNGTSGQVFQVKDRVSKVKLALKIIRKHDRCDEYTQKVILKERALFEKLTDCPWFVHLSASWHDHDNFYFAMTLYPTDLDSEMIRCNIIKPERARFYMAEIIVALTELHSRGIIHRDVKAPNILIDREGHIVLADFGLSKDFNKRPSIAERVYQPYWPYLETDDAHRSLEPREPHELHFVAFGYRGSDLEMAPEIHLSQPYSFGVDFWSAAVVLFWMVTGRPPFYVMEEEYIDRDSKDVKPLKDRILEDCLCWTTDDDVDDETIDFLERMLEKRPENRLKIGFEIPNHPYFAGVNWPLMERRMVPPPWIPGKDVSHAYEPPSEIFQLGESYAEDEEDPYPEFNFTSEEMQYGLIDDDSDSEGIFEDDDFGQYYSTHNAQDDASSPVRHICSNPTTDDQVICVGEPLGHDSHATYTSEGDDASHGSPSTNDHSSIDLSFQDDTTDEALSLQESWDVTLVTPPRSQPSSPGPKQWLYPQDVIKIRVDVTSYSRSFSTSTSSSNVTEGCMIPIKDAAFKIPIEICLTSSPSEPHVILSSAFGHLSDQSNPPTCADNAPTVSAPLIASPGLLIKTKNWFTSLWSKGSK